MGLALPEACLYRYTFAIAHDSEGGIHLAVVNWAFTQHCRISHNMFLRRIPVEYRGFRILE